MQAYEFSEERWALKLAPQLTGKAQQAYAAMESSQAASYVELKAAILRRYKINEETYRQRFRTARRKDGEMQAELVICLTDTAKKWIKTCKTMEDQLDLVVMEQFLNTLHPDTRIWVKERKPKTGAEAGQLADDHAQARKQADQAPRRVDKMAAGPRKCHNYGAPGHFARDCSKPKLPKSEPGSEQTPVRESKRGEENPVKDVPTPKLVVKCYNCGQPGHISRRCPSNTALLCQAARRPAGELSRVGNGVSRRGLVEGLSVNDILQDTGCSKTLVRNDLVPDDKLLRGMQ